MLSDSGAGRGLSVDQLSGDVLLTHAHILAPSGGACRLSGVNEQTPSLSSATVKQWSGIRLRSCHKHLGLTWPPTQLTSLTLHSRTPERVLWTGCTLVISLEQSVNELRSVCRVITCLEKQFFKRCCFCSFTHFASRNDIRRFRIPPLTGRLCSLFQCVKKRSKLWCWELEFAFRRAWGCVCSRWALQMLLRNRRDGLQQTPGPWLEQVTKRIDNGTLCSVPKEKNIRKKAKIFHVTPVSTYGLINSDQSSAFK